MPERPIGAVSKTVVEVPSTVGSNPTLSAENHSVEDAHTATLSAENHSVEDAHTTTLSAEEDL